jgi:hypothetical protein
MTIPKNHGQKLKFSAMAKAVSGSEGKQCLTKAALRRVFGRGHETSFQLLSVGCGTDSAMTTPCRRRRSASRGGRLGCSKREYHDVLSVPHPALGQDHIADLQVCVTTFVCISHLSMAEKQPLACSRPGIGSHLLQYSLPGHNHTCLGQFQFGRAQNLYFLYRLLP